MVADELCERPAAAPRRKDSGPPAPLTGLTITGDLTAAKKLRSAYAGTNGQSLFGQTAQMPEGEFFHDIKDELDRLLYLTLTVSIDYQRDAAQLWRHARERYADPKTTWLFRPAEVAKRTADDVLAALQTGNPKGALRYPPKDAAWWHHNATLLATHYQGDPRVLFKSCGWDVMKVWAEVRKRKFQGLRGAKIFPLWIRILKVLQHHPFVNYEALPIPVDVHVARATFTTGLIKGKYEGPFDSNLIDFIRQAWTSACAKQGESHMSFDESLWQVSRLGCTKRNVGPSGDCPRRKECAIGTTCPKGRIELANTTEVRIDT